MSDAATDEAPAKEKLSPEERAERVRSARYARVSEAFDGKQFEYVEQVDMGESERYTDVTGNKGRHGHRIRNIATGEEMVVGPNSLKRLAEVFGAITLPEKPTRSKKAKDTTADEEG